MKPCFLFWKNTAKQITPTPPKRVPRHQAAIVLSRNGFPSKQSCGVSSYFIIFVTYVVMSGVTSHAANGRANGGRADVARHVAGEYSSNHGLC